MRALLTVAIVVMLCLVAPGAVTGQTCGNANGQGIIDLADVSALMSYILYGNPLPNPAYADCDGHEGITMCDVLTITNYLFQSYMDTIFDCSQSHAYSMTFNNNDTFYIPYMTNIPDGIDSVSLPLVTTLGPGGIGYSLPLLKLGTGSSSNFTYSGMKVIDNSSKLQRTAAQIGDTVTVQVLEFQGPDRLVGKRTIVALNYKRTAPGVGNLFPQAVDRTFLWSPTVARYKDLTRPYLVSSEIILPPETLKTTPTSLAFSTMAGKVTADSFLVSFTSSSLPISFNLTTSDPWILLRNLPAGPLTTPTSIWVRADATALPIGTYNGQINMIPVIPGKPTDPAFVTVSFTVTQPVLYPPGDFNCDGVANLADLSIFVSYLTGGSAHLTDCNR
jgi:hypothetical protein